MDPFSSRFRVKGGSLSQPIHNFLRHAVDGIRSFMSSCAHMCRLPGVFAITCGSHAGFSQTHAPLLKVPLTRVFHFGAHKRDVGVVGIRAFGSWDAKRYRVLTAKTATITSQDLIGSSAKLPIWQVYSSQNDGPILYIIYIYWASVYIKGKILLRSHKRTINLRKHNRSWPWSRTLAWIK